jgi:hypothetical protein
MEHFVTIFDRLFLPQGLALLLSMQRHISDFTLWVICMDEKTRDVLDAYNVPNLKLLEIEKLETDELVKIKEERSRGEYCWTLTAHVPKFVFASDPEIQRVTYIDSDLWFLADPTPVFKELEDVEKAVLITEHNYAPEYAYLNKFGKFCVQFMVFNRDTSEDVRKWWEDRCMEWCYGRLEDGKFGDQKYLDEFENLFPNDVHVLQNKNLALAPWNATMLDHSQSVFFHFHGVRLLDQNRIHLGRYELPSNLCHSIFRPYYEDLNHALRFMVQQSVIPLKQVSMISVFRGLIKRICEFLLYNRKRIWMIDSLKA